MNLDLLLPADPDRDTFGWATVTGIAPLRIRLDGEDDPLPVDDPDTLIGPLSPSDRVWVALSTNDDPAFRGRRVVVIGRAGGVEAELEDLADDIDDHEDRIADLEATTSLADTQATSGTNSSTSYTATLSGGTTCSKVFVAPPSGAVEIYIGGRIVNNTAGADVFIAFEVRAGGSVGSGTVHTNASADDARSYSHPGTSPMSAGVSYPVTGLTPGATYNVRQMFKVSAGQGTYSNKNLIVRRNLA